MADRQDWTWQEWNEASLGQRLGMVWNGQRTLITAMGLAVASIGVWWTWEYVAAVVSWLGRYSEEIRNLMLSAGVIGAGIGVWIAFRRSETERLRQVTDSFAKAVELLGHEDRSVRLGAIYALERIARQNRDEHWPVMETLTAYVRDWSRPLAAYVRDRSEEKARQSGADHDPAAEQEEAPGTIVHPEPAPIDIQAVATVLGRRRVEHEHHLPPHDRPERRLNLNSAYFVGARCIEGDLRGAELMQADLQRSDLWKANLSGANARSANLRSAKLAYTNLSRANFSEADLSMADLSRANLTNANLRRARLADADLWHANLSAANLRDANLAHTGLSAAKLSQAALRRADLSRADLSKANLTRSNLRWATLADANLSEANLGEADLEHANLCGADLSTARGLTQEQLNAAHGDADTMIPPDLTRPEHWLLKHDMADAMDHRERRPE